MIGKQIKNYLESKGISQTYISKHTGIPITRLNSRLNGKSELKAEELYLIGSALNVPLETLRQFGKSE